MFPDFKITNRNLQEFRNQIMKNTGQENGTRLIKRNKTT